MKKTFISLVILFSFLLGQKAPIHKLSENGPIQNWLIAGPFSNAQVKDAYDDNSWNYGYYHDILTSIGGEKNTVLEENMDINFTDEKGKQKSMSVQQIITESNGIVSMDKIFGNIDYHGAYGFCYIDSDKDQNALLTIGSDDDIKIWLNGELVFKFYGGRALVPGENKTAVNLKKGMNRLLVKNTDWVRDWGFAISVFDELETEKIKQQEKIIAQKKQFLNCKIVPESENQWDFYFSPGPFPKMVWDNPFLAEEVLGTKELTTRWFDAELNEVKKAEKSGRYGFVCETVSKEGMIVQRAGTIYCNPWEWLVWAERPDAFLDYIPVNGIDKEVWKTHDSQISKYMGRMLIKSILEEKDGAILLSYLHEIDTKKKYDARISTPIIYDNEFHLKLKQKVLDLDFTELKYPKKISKSTKILRKGNINKTGMNSDVVKEMDEVCSEWYRDSEEPFVVYLAKDGVEIFHKAYGQRKEIPISTETTFPLASISKLITGTLFAQFLDQGLIDLDDPVGKYLSDFPTKGKNTITIRQCFTHTCGLWGHEMWDGMHNPYLENVTFNALELGLVNPGIAHNYNGTGYNLAGRVMEVVSGKSIFRLCHENLFEPLGLEQIVMQEDLAFSANCTAKELATIGQLLLNNGSYGKKQFFSSETFQKILPKDLSKFYPGINLEWGIGITWMNQPHPESGNNGVPTDKTLLSDKVIGHGSATSSIINIDLENGIVLTQTRFYGGKNYDNHRIKMLEVIDQNISR
ncbi:serine hydrolase [Methanococcoides sp. SA1]|nr:serine hydrolase [Methanococcoides sp. SA1]